MDKITFVAENGEVLFTPTGSTKQNKDIGLNIEQIAIEYPLYLKEIANRLANAEQKIELFEKTKQEVLERMVEFENEYNQYSESSLDYFGGKAEAMQVAMTIVKNTF